VKAAAAKRFQSAVTRRGQVGPGREAVQIGVPPVVVDGGGSTLAVGELGPHSAAVEIDARGVAVDVGGSLVGVGALGGATPFAHRCCNGSHARGRDEV
jgi:hypothetical protein